MKHCLDLLTLLGAIALFAFVSLALSFPGSIFADVLLNIFKV